MTPKLVRRLEACEFSRQSYTRAQPICVVHMLILAVLFLALTAFALPRFVFNSTRQFSLRTRLAIATVAGVVATFGVFVPDGYSVL